jgi:hypothetical protein
MEKIYQPVVINIADDFINSLSEDKFFEDNQITNINFVKTHLCNKLTEKFITGELLEEEGFFTEEEFEQLLREFIAGSILNDLKDKGYLNSYEDDETEEMFFLTEEGKEFLDKLNTEFND